MASSAKKRLRIASEHDIIMLTDRETENERLVGDDIPRGVSVLCMTTEPYTGQAIRTFNGYLRRGTRYEVEATVYYKRRDHEWVNDRALDYISQLVACIAVRKQEHGDIQLVNATEYPRGSKDGVCLYTIHPRCSGLADAVREVRVLDAHLHQAAAAATRDDF